jgi:hypothetical protein
MGLKGPRNVKGKGLLIILLCVLLLVAATVLVSCSEEGTAEESPEASSASGDAVQQTEEAQADEGALIEEEAYPYVDWYDYRYTFMGAWRDRDLNPTSEVVDYGGDYVHLRVKVTMTSDERPDLKAPLQVLLNCKGREYRIFGKDYSKYSYIWRDYTDFPDDVGESHVYIVTMELMPYSRALNSSFAMDQAELVLNGIDWSNLEQPQTVPLSRVPLAQLGAGGTSSP